MRHLLLLVAAIGCLASCSNPPTPLRVTNRSAVPLEEVIVSGSGFRQSLGTIAPGATRTAGIRPKGESGLAISFNAGGRHSDFPPGGYFEGGGHYAVTAVVGADLDVTVDATLRTY